ncbi:MAG: hypothetical protein AB7T10_01380 [bacterium]
MTKINLSAIFIAIFALISAESFTELVGKLGIYEDSIQIYSDSILVNEYKIETTNLLTDWLKSDDWVKRAVGIRVLSKIHDKQILKQVLKEKNIDAYYGFRIFEKESLCFFTDYEKPLKSSQYVSFIRMASNRGWEYDFDEIVRITESKDASDYVIVQALTALTEMADKDNFNQTKLGKRFFTQLLKRNNASVDEKIVNLMAKIAFSPDSVLSEKADERDKINLVRYYTISADTSKLMRVGSFHSGFSTNHRLMLNYETEKYLEIFSDSALEDACKNSGLIDIYELILKVQGERNGD